MSAVATYYGKSGTVGTGAAAVAVHVVDESVTRLKLFKFNFGSRGLKEKQVWLLGGYLFIGTPRKKRKSQTHQIGKSFITLDGMVRKMKVVDLRYISNVYREGNMIQFTCSLEHFKLLVSSSEEGENFVQMMLVAREIAIKQGLGHAQITATDMKAKRLANVIVSQQWKRKQLDLEVEKQCLRFSV